MASSLISTLYVCCSGLSVVTPLFFKQCSLQVIPDALVERSVQNSCVGTVFQFERLGYFCVDKDIHQHNVCPFCGYYDLTSCLLTVVFHSSSSCLTER